MFRCCEDEDLGVVVHATYEGCVGDEDDAQELLIEAKLTNRLKGFVNIHVLGVILAAVAAALPDSEKSKLKG